MKVAPLVITSLLYLHYFTLSFSRKDRVSLKNKIEHAVLLAFWETRHLHENRYILNSKSLMWAGLPGPILPISG
jgi:hypothetical protein